MSWIVDRRPAGLPLEDACRERVDAFLCHHDDQASRRIFELGLRIESGPRASTELPGERP